MNIRVEENDIRIDIYLREKTDFSRSKIQKLIKNSKVLVNQKEVSSNYKVMIDDIIEILEKPIEPLENLKPSNLEVNIIYEDDDLMVINKASGMVVHPAPGNYEDTLVNALLFKHNLSSNSFRPGIVHRLDKDTSGLMLVAKNDYTHEKLSKMISEKIVERTYWAVVEGGFNHQSGTVDAPIGRDPKNRERMTVTSVNSKAAVTHFKVLQRYNKYTLIECVLETGRTHQIRVHMKYINHPIVNDKVYGHVIPNYEDFGQLLHSKKIRFPHPKSGKILEFEVEPPKEFMDILNFIVND